jgi:hypothetical protein
MDACIHCIGVISLAMRHFINSPVIYSVPSVLLFFTGLPGHIQLPAKRFMGFMVPKISLKQYSNDQSFVN